ncbi:hypothetical protein ACFYXH_02180 [Streptomyces sp. NPDC002730]|uniref:hypothetical protein n=1 Tax=Streptomyces sp. NPDC002730 TaxID=3364662 RepID=UPI0036D1FAAD
MALSARWQELFDADSSGARMSLASANAPGDGGRGGPDHKASQGPWTRASGVADALHTSSASALTELETAAKVEAKSTAGLDSTKAMSEVLGSWKVRLTAVRDECGRLEGSLKSAGKEFGEQEVRIKRTFEGRTGGPK